MQFDQWKGQNKDAPFNIGQTFYANSALVVKRDGKAGRMLLLSFRIDYDDRKGTVSLLFAEIALWIWQEMVLKNRKYF